jgi:hypothetical protein
MKKAKYILMIQKLYGPIFASAQNYIMSLQKKKNTLGGLIGSNQ